MPPSATAVCGPQGRRCPPPQTAPGTVRRGWGAVLVQNAHPHSRHIVSVFFPKNRPADFDFQVQLCTGAEGHAAHYVAVLYGIEPPSGSFAAPVAHIFAVKGHAILKAHFVAQHTPAEFDLVDQRQPCQAIFPAASRQSRTAAALAGEKCSCVSSSSPMVSSITKGG